MDLGSIFLILALALLISLYISRPFMNREIENLPLVSRELDVHEHERTQLLAERDRVLTALQDLDFDHSLGKIPEEDFPVQRTALLQAGSIVLRRLDALNPVGTVVAAAGTSGMVNAEDSNDAGEAALQATAYTSPDSTDDELEALIAARRLTRPEQSAGFCAKCGQPLKKNDTFCCKCGAKTV